MRFPVTIALLMAPGCKAPEYLGECPRNIDAPAELIELSVPPWVQWTRYSLRVRFETRLEAPLPVVVEQGDVCPVVYEPDLLIEERDFVFPAKGGVDWPDVAGQHVLQTANMTDLDLFPGIAMPWTIEYGPSEILEGEVLAPPAEPTDFRAVFTGSTMAPVSEQLATAMAATEPAIFLHGGDLQHQQEDTDTWTGFFQRFAPVLEGAVFQPTVGDRDFEAQDEYATQYGVRFEGQGRAAGELDRYGIDWGQVRFVFLNSPEGVDSQLSWLDDELSGAVADDLVEQVVLVVHHSGYSLAGTGPDLDVRAALQDALAEYPIPLVLSSGNHAYERFEVDGVHWVSDGGGGAELDDLDAAAAAYPDDVALRVAADASHGFTQLDFGADGTASLTRFDLDGGVVDTVEIAP